MGSDDENLLSHLKIKIVFKLCYLYVLNTSSAERPGTLTITFESIWQCKKELAKVLR